MAEPTASLRWAVPSDAERIADYHYACWIQAFAPLVDPQVMEVIAPRVERWRHWLDPESEFVTVVAVDQADQPVGHATVNGNELIHLFIDPDHHRQGLGRQLPEVGERLIRQAGHAQAQLHTIVGNTPAIAMYESCGWVLTDELSVDELDNGSSYTEHVMRKDFAAPNHVEANRTNWEDDAPNWIERGRRSWAAEPHWGEMAIPESQVRVLPELDGCDVVELGCGTGYVSAWCLQAGAKSVVGVDNSSSQLRSAQVLQREFALRFPLVWTDAERLPLADDSFDVAINEYGAALWCDPSRWIPEAGRVLRPGGKLVFLTWSAMMSMAAPDFEDEPTSTALLRSQRDVSSVTFPDTEGLQFALSHGQWIDLLTANGFTVDRLVELYAPNEDQGGPERYSYFDAAWARRWPPEEIWTATLAG